MGEIQPEKCEGRELTKHHLGTLTDIESLLPALTDIESLPLANSRAQRHSHSRAASLHLPLVRDDATLHRRASEDPKRRDSRARGRW